jgi:Flp pilus assembly protein TadD
MEKGEHQKAEAIFKSVQSKLPDESAIHWNLAVIYMNTDRYELARRELREYLRCEPNSQEAKELVRDLEDL